MKYKVNGNLPEIIIEANNETEAIEKYLHETEYNEITVKEIKNE